jgi:hypothetical protein
MRFSCLGETNCGKLAKSAQRHVLEPVAYAVLLFRVPVNAAAGPVLFENFATGLKELNEWSAATDV